MTDPMMQVGKLTKVLVVSEWFVSIKSSSFVGLSDCWIGSS
jgi:hypothetical protein